MRTGILAALSNDNFEMCEMAQCTIPRTNRIFRDGPRSQPIDFSYGEMPRPILLLLFSYFFFFLLNACD